ncbi:MAG: 50S ribosomal protein L30 [Thermoproteota archaeon]
MDKVGGRIVVNEECKRINDMEGKLLAIVRVRSGINRDRQTLETLRSLRLERPNTAVLLQVSPQLEGQLMRIRDVAFWGPIEKDTLIYLLEKRGRMVGNKRITEESIKSCTGYSSIEEFADSLLLGKVKLSEIRCLKSFFRLSPPSSRASRKRHGTDRGLLGYLGKRADEVIKKMI